MDGGADPTLTIVLALLGFLGLTVAPIAVAFINRGGKARPAELAPPPVDIVAELDEELHRAQRLERQLREERDRYYERAIRAESHLARLGIDPDPDGAQP